MARTYNTYTYTVLPATVQAKAYIETKGFNEFFRPAESFNKQYMIIDKQDNERIPILLDYVIPKPAWAKETFSDWPYLTHEEALKLVHYTATQPDGSDGWGINKEGE